MLKLYSFACAHTVVASIRKCNQTSGLIVFFVRY